MQLSERNIGRVPQVDSHLAERHLQLTLVLLVKMSQNLSWRKPHAFAIIHRSPEILIEQHLLLIHLHEIAVRCHDFFHLLFCKPIRHLLVQLCNSLGIELGVVDRCHCIYRSRQFHAEEPATARWVCQQVTYVAGADELGIPALLIHRIGEELSLLAVCSLQQILQIAIL